MTSGNHTQSSGPNNNNNNKHRQNNKKHSTPLDLEQRAKRTPPMSSLPQQQSSTTSPRLGNSSPNFQSQNFSSGTPCGDNLSEPPSLMNLDSEAHPSLELPPTHSEHDQSDSAELQVSPSNGSTSSGGMESYPAIVQWVIINIFKPCFEEGEDFASFIRKVAVLTYSIMASAGWMLILFFVIISIEDDKNGWAPLRINMIGMGFYMMIWYVCLNYTYIRKTQRCPNWLADIASVGAVLGMFSFTIATLEADTRVLLMSTLLLTAMCSSARFTLLAILHAAVYLFHYLRQNFREEIPALVFPWDHAPHTLPEKILVLFVLSIVPSLGAVLGMYVIITNYIKRSQEGQVASRMTFEIAAQLQRYDCDGMGETLATNKEFVDIKLWNAFDAIRENLKSYRPHIPAYLIQAAIERAEEQELEMAREMLSDYGDDGDGAAHDICSDQSEGDLKWETASVTSRTSNSSRLSKSSTFGSSARLTHSGSKHHQSASSFNSVEKFSGPVTSVYLELGAKNLSIALQEMNGVVELLNQMGQSTNSSLHYIDGDSLFVTINATNRVGNHEIRACNFALRAVEALSKHKNLSPCASVVTCQATAIFAGTTQAHFMLVGEEMERHHYQRQLAKRHRTVVCNSQAADTADVQFSFIGFDVDDRSKPIYELVQSKQSGREDEWMYMLEAQNNEETNPYAKAGTLQPLLELDKFEEARAVLDNLPKDIAERSTVKALAARVQ